MSRLSLRNNPLKFKIAGKLLLTLEESIEYTQFNKEDRKMSTCNRLDSGTLGYGWLYPKISWDIAPVGSEFQPKTSLIDGG